MDNVAVLGIEQCLLSGLADIFSPNVVMKMEDDVLREIAAEPADVQAERKRLTDKLDNLEEGQKTLNSLNRHKSAGKCPLKAVALPSQALNPISWGIFDGITVYEREHPLPSISQSSSFDSVENLVIPKRNEHNTRSDRRRTTGTIREHGSESPMAQLKAKQPRASSSTTPYNDSP